MNVIRKQGGRRLRNTEQHRGADERRRTSLVLEQSGRIEQGEQEFSQDRRAGLIALEGLGRAVLEIRISTQHQLSRDAQEHDL